MPCGDVDDVAVGQRVALTVRCAKWCLRPRVKWVVLADPEANEFCVVGSRST